MLQINHLINEPIKQVDYIPLSADIVVLSSMPPLSTPHGHARTVKHASHQLYVSISNKYIVFCVSFILSIVPSSTSAEDYRHLLTLLRGIVANVHTVILKLGINAVG